MTALSLLYLLTGEEEQGTLEKLFFQQFPTHTEIKPLLIHYVLVT